MLWSSKRKRTRFAESKLSHKKIIQRFFRPVVDSALKWVFIRFPSVVYDLSLRRRHSRPFPQTECIFKDFADRENKPDQWTGPQSKYFRNAFSSGRLAREQAEKVATYSNREKHFPRPLSPRERWIWSFCFEYGLFEVHFGILIQCVGARVMFEDMM